MTVLDRAWLLDLLVRAAAIGYDQGGAGGNGVELDREISARLGHEVEAQLPAGTSTALLLPTARPDDVPWSQLSETMLLELVSRADRELSARNGAALAEHAMQASASSPEIRQLVARHGAVKRLVFGTAEYDNGWWFEPRATATFGDGAQEEVDLGDLEEDLTEVAGTTQPLTRRSTVRIHLASPHDHPAAASPLPRVEVCATGPEQ